MAETISLFLAGDVMTGRGVDQILPNAGDPTLHEPFVRDARTYVELAEQTNGPIARPVGFADIWGDALRVLERADPDARIVNLETSVTSSDDAWPGKGIHYRMHPDNVPCLTAAGLDCCVLANNHVLDWGHAGLDETLATLRSSGLRAAGAGHDAADALAPAVIDVGADRRVLVFGCAATSSGVPAEWAARENRPGINLLAGVSRAAAGSVADAIAAHRRPGDIVVVSIHWGGNWGYEIPEEQRALAHALIDDADVDVVHGHSSHHAKGVEIHGGRPVIYGCGDFLSDYEGIPGHDEYRGDVPLGYFIELLATGEGLARFEVVPFRLRRLSLEAAPQRDVEWIRSTLERESAPLGTRIARTQYGTLSLEAE